MMRVLLTRPAEDSKKLAEQVRAMGMVPVIAPMTDIVETGADLPMLSSFQAVAFTSKRAVEIFSRQTQERDLPAYCVGSASARAAIGAGFRTVREAGGTAKSLSALILTEKPGAVLYCAPADKAYPLGDVLRQEGVLCEEVTLYSAVAGETIPDDVLALLRKNDIDFALFFSKRTAEIFLNLIAREGCTPALKTIKALCLSDGVLQSANKDYWARTAVPKYPDSDAMLALLKEIVEGRTMTKSNKNIENAEIIIERFGGIRPMASKIDVPVTTVQGWKKRNVIPGARRALIMEAANVNNIDLSDVLDAANGVSAKPSAEVREFPKRDDSNDNDAARVETKVEKTEVKKERYEPLKGIGSSDDIMAEIEASEKKAIRNSVWASSALIALVIFGGGLMLWPGANDFKERLNIHGEQIDVLEEDVAVLDETVRDTSRRAGMLNGIMPDDLQSKFEGLQNQAQNLQLTFEQLDEKTRALRENVLAPGAGDMAARLAALEQSIGGQEQIKLAVEELQGIVSGLDSKISSLEERLQAAQSADGPLGATLDGVSGNDLKAAAMLIAFSQLRDSLNREAPFEDDLILLQKMVGADDAELQEAITRLAPHADGGVLTSEGLSNQFKGLAGDIVVASLNGEDVSLADKAKARFNEIMQVEKDGEVISGTDTQATVSQAQAMLDNGDIEGAVALLQTLQGPAAEQAEPFIEQAEVSLLAEQVQTLLRETILTRVSGVLPQDGTPRIIKPSGSGTINMNQIKETIKDAMPQKKVIKDEESGVTILPREQGFKGLSDY